MKKFYDTCALLNAGERAFAEPFYISMVTLRELENIKTSRSKDAALNAERGEKGTLLASGFIAGGALMGVASAAMRFGGINLVNDAWLQNTWSEVLALGAYAILIFYLIKASMKITFKYQEHEKDSTFIFSICNDHVIRTKAR